MSKKRVTVSIPSKGLDEIAPKLQRNLDGTASSSEGESDSQDELNDEMDLDAVSSDGEIISSAEEEEETHDSERDDDVPRLKKRKKVADDGSSSFASAVNAILGSKLKAYDRKDPILARSKVTIKKAESEKLEAKARRELLAEKKIVYDKDRVRDLLPKEDSNARAILEHEKKLKKIAQRGVVRLFNVIMTTQSKTNAEVSQTKVLDGGKKEKLISEISKEKFFDLVKAAGDS
jgi:hypothetical protein